MPLEIPPLGLLAIGVTIVLVTLLWLRLNAFLGLIIAAIVVSLLAKAEPGETGEKLTRVAEAFGHTAGGIGIAIALAAVIGSCLIASGAADRIVQAALAVCGEKRGATALTASGFVLSVPVFFDTVFYLLFPLARSMYRRTGHSYVKYLLAIGAGGAVTHTMVPPTPGPLLMASEIGVNVGLLMLVGAAVGVPMAVSGLLYAGWIDRRLVLEQPPELVDPLTSPDEITSTPGLVLSLLPIVLPIAMIASQPIAEAVMAASAYQNHADWLTLIADKNLALLAAAVVALLIFVSHKRPKRGEVSQVVEQALVSAGMIVLITAAGGAFGGMLKAADVGPAIQKLFSHAGGEGFEILWLAFALAAMLKTSQGSTTVAIITTSSMIAAMQEGAVLGMHPVYLCTAIGSGAMITSWLNDSGFWIFCRMGGLSESEGLITWAPMNALMGVVGMATTLLLATLFPLV